MKPPTLKFLLFTWVVSTSPACAESDDGPATAHDSGVDVDGSESPAPNDQFSVEDARTFDDWSALLSAYGRGPCFDYARLSENTPDANRLQRAARLFAEVSPTELASREERLAYWINAYNTFMVSLVLANRDRYSRDTVLADAPDGPTFRTRRFNVAGNSVSLDDIEHAVLRQDLARVEAGLTSDAQEWLREQAAAVWGTNDFDPRIHFAVNCASVGCPDLLVRPWLASTISTDLELQTSAFLNDTGKGAGPDGVSDLLLSYYPDDFDSQGGLEAFVRRYNSNANLTRSLGYDWTLNQCR